MRLYFEIAARAFRRSTYYRGAALAGLFTNAVFGAILTYMYKAVYGAGGDQDRALSLDNLAEMPAHVPNLEIRRYPQSGHWSPHQLFPDVVPVLREFLAK